MVKIGLCTTVTIILKRLVTTKRTAKEAKGTAMIQPRRVALNITDTAINIAAPLTAGAAAMAEAVLAAAAAAIVVVAVMQFILTMS